MANDVLNEQIDMDKARLYSTLVRTVAQSAGLAAQRDRFDRKKPEFTFTQPEV